MRSGATNWCVDALLNDIYDVWRKKIYVQFFKKNSSIFRIFDEILLFEGWLCAGVYQIRVMDAMSMQICVLEAF